MKNFSIFLFILILSISACKDLEGNDSCEGPLCPLSTGEYCANNMINSNDVCDCPDGFVEFDNNCFDSNDPLLSQIDNIMFERLNCGCVQDEAFIFNFSIETSTLIGWYITNGTDQPLYFDSNIQGTPSIHNFYANIYPLACCQPEDTGTNTKPLYMHGSVIEDTLYYDLFFYNTLDTCKGFKQGDFRL